MTQSKKTGKNKSNKVAPAMRFPCEKPKFFYGLTSGCVKGTPEKFRVSTGNNLRQHKPVWQVVHSEQGRLNS